MERAAVGLAPGWLVISVGVFFNAVVLAFALGTLKLRQASSEVQSQEEFEWHPIQQVSKWADANLRRRNTIRRAKKARHRTSSVIHKTNA